MATQKTILCLANSSKLSAQCVAGVELETGDWVRPLGSGPHGAITDSEQRLTDGTNPELLDLVQLWLSRHDPTPGHPENWQLAPGRWQRQGRLDDAAARPILEALAVDSPLFGTDERSVSVEDVAASSVTSSLALVRPQQLTWRKEIWEKKSKVVARFRHASAWHELPVTDPRWKAEFDDDEPGTSTTTQTKMSSSPSASASPIASGTGSSWRA